MGRLIDADVITDFMLEHNTQDSLFASVEEIVSYQPTAYDVDAVVKQIEEWNEVAGAIPEGSSWYYELLWIVKNGGVE